MNNEQKMVMEPRELLKRCIQPVCEQADWDKLKNIAADQNHGEPVAWHYPKTGLGDQLSYQQLDHYWPIPGGAEHEYVKGIPLYTHADPGEVERLRNCLRTEVEAGDSWKREADELRAQLAEWDALLSEIRGQSGASWLRGETRHKLDAALSASAEPSAPVEIDEREMFEKAVIDKAERFHPNLEQFGEHPDAEYRDPSIEWAWGLWQARAALERK